jgi:transcriptional regulator with XRE-family HTH domain
MRIRPPDIIDHVIGQNIRRLRVRAGMTQQSLGAAVGLTFQQVQKYEYGRDHVPARRLYDISVALGVPIEWFFQVARDKVS